MSVEEQLSNAVQACNNLTAAVNGKISQIDQKVNAATSAVPDKIKSSMDAKLYVDSVNGNDANDGLSQASPKRSILAAVDSVPRSSNLHVMLLGQRVYEIDNDVSCSGKLLIIESYGATWGNPSTRSTIRAKQLTYLGEYKAGQFLTGFGSEIHINQVNLETVQFESVTPVYNDYRNSLFSGSSSSSQVWLYGCSVTLNNGPLMHQHPNGSFGKLDLYMNNVVVSINDAPIPDGKSVIMGHYGMDAIPFALYAASVGLPSGKTWTDMVTANKSAANTNVTFA
ncbi:MAG: hypothetical protein SNF94_05425 [Rikenellaceae bacterium]